MQDFAERVDLVVARNRLVRVVTPRRGGAGLTSLCDDELKHEDDLSFNAPLSPSATSRVFQPGVRQVSVVVGDSKP